MQERSRPPDHPGPRSSSASSTPSTSLPVCLRLDGPVCRMSSPVLLSKEHKVTPSSAAPWISSSTESAPCAIGRSVDFRYAPAARIVVAIHGKKAWPMSESGQDFSINHGKAGRGSIDAWFRDHYGHLRGIARLYLARERRGHTLQPTALVNEVYLKFVAQRSITPRDDAHFKALAALAMWQVLVDHARRRMAARRRPVPTVILGGDAGSFSVRLDECLMLEQAIQRLETQGPHGPRMAEQVRCRWLGALTEIELAGHFGVSDRTIRREWTFAQTWLRRELTR